jgi:hypothetical protein
LNIFSIQVGAGGGAGGGGSGASDGPGWPGIQSQHWSSAPAAAVAAAVTGVPAANPAPLAHPDYNAYHQVKTKLNYQNYRFILISMVSIAEKLLLCFLFSLFLHSIHVRCCCLVLHSSFSILNKSIFRSQYQLFFSFFFFQYYQQYAQQFSQQQQYAAAWNAWQQSQQ